MSERPVHGRGDGWATACGQDRANVWSWTDDPGRVTCRACLPAAPDPTAGERLEAACPDCGALNTFREKAPNMSCGSCQYEASDRDWFPASPPAVAASTGTSEDVEALARQVWCDPGEAERIAIRAVLASDWLAAREAAARAEERERIALAIEAQRITCPDHSIPDCSPLLNGCSTAIRLRARLAVDARIAREGR